MLPESIQNQRRGKITASKTHSIMAGWDVPRPTDAFHAEIYDWMTKHDRKPQVGEIKDVLPCECSGKTIGAAWEAFKFDKVPQGLITYAEELACEELFEVDPNAWNGEGNQSIADGNEREVDAMIWLSEQTGIDFVHTGDDQIHISEKGIGATPDGIAYDDLDLIVTGGEAKCRSPIHHMRQLLIKDNASCIELDFDRYCQMQTAMLATSTDHWYTVNYNPLGKFDGIKARYCVIKRDEPFIKIIKQRAEIVFEHKARFIAAYMGDAKQEKAA